MVERGYRCPRCGAGPRMIVERYDGSLKCLQCDCAFRIDGWVPKLYVRDLRPARYLGERARAFIDLMRPLTLVAAGLAGFFLVLLCSAYYGSPFDCRLALGCGASLALLQAAGQALNQSLPEEIAIDRASGKVYRPTVRGLVTPAEGALFSSVLFVLGVSVAFHMGVFFGLLSVVIAFFAAFYTLPPLRVKRRFVVNNLWQGVSRGLLPVLAVGHGLFGAGDSFPLCMGWVIAVWMAGAQPTKDFADEAGDRAFGIRTLPVVLGRRGAMLVMGGFVAASFVLLWSLIGLGLLPAGFGWLTALLAPSLLIFYALERGWESELVENSVAWGLMYATLGLWYVLPPLILKAL